MISKIEEVMKSKPSFYASSCASENDIRNAETNLMLSFSDEYAHYLSDSDKWRVQPKQLYSDIFQVLICYHLKNVTHCKFAGVRNGSFPKGNFTEGSQKPRLVHMTKRGFFAYPS